MKKEEAIKKIEIDFETLKEMNYENESEENEEDIEEEVTELDEAAEASDIKSNENIEERKTILMRKLRKK